MSLANITKCLLAGCAFILPACGSTSMDFERMSLPELMTYNRTVEPMDQVYCADEIRAGSHIRRRHCETLIEIAERVAKSASTINIIGTAQIY